MSVPAVREAEPRANVDSADGRMRGEKAATPSLAMTPAATAGTSPPTKTTVQQVVARFQPVSFRIAASGRLQHDAPRVIANLSQARVADNLRGRESSG